MSFLSGIRALLQRRRAVRELDIELAFHIEMETEANVRRGMSADEARRKAIADFGGVGRTRDHVLDVRAHALDAIWQDLRSAARSLAGARGFTISAAATLGLGIGIATAMFTVIDSLVLRPVPYHEPQQLASLRTVLNERGLPPPMSMGVLEAWRDSPAFDAAEIARTDEALLEFDGNAISGDIAYVSAGIFDLLGGIQPLHGRFFVRDELVVGEAVISESFWRRQYDRDPAVLGRQISVDDETVTVVGVVPDDVHFPSARTDLWRIADPAAGFRYFAYAYVRFSKDIPRDDALGVAIEAASAVDPAFAGRDIWVDPIAFGLRDEYSSRAIFFLASGVVLVFLVLCANICGLMLARLTARRGDFGVRAVLGAGRHRLMRQAFAESTMIGIGGILLGAGIAWACLIVAERLIPPSLFAQTLNALNLDARALAMTSVVGLVAILATGLLPAWLASRVDVAGSLRGIDTRGTEFRGAHLLGRGLLVVEIALACMLLAGATLLTRSFVNLTSIDRGLDVEGVTVMNLYIGDSVDSEDQSSIDAMIAAIEEQLRALPGVQQLAWHYGIPPRGGGGGNNEWTSDLPGAAPQVLQLGEYRVSPEYLPLYGIPIVRGRNLSAADRRTGVVVSERFAEALWGSTNPVGRTLQFRQESGRIENGQVVTRLSPPQTFSVVGVAGEIRFPSLGDSARYDIPQIYWLYEPFTVPMLSLRCEPVCQIAAVRQRLNAAFGDSIVVQDVDFANSEYAAAMVRPRTAAGLSLFFAGIALVAAATGLFSVLSYIVNSRRRELGIRVALGASPDEIRRFIYRDGLAVTVTGLSIGVLLAFVFGRILSALQYGVTTADPISVLIVIATIALTAAIAMWRPARDAGSVDPVSLLRQE